MSRAFAIVGLLLAALPVSAQLTPSTLPAHVIVDSCSGCGGSAGPIAIDQTTPGTTNGVVVNNVPHIVCDSGCGSPPATADNSAFTFGTTSVSPIGAVVDDVATNAVTENSFGAPRMSTTRVLYVDLKQTQANATALKVDGSAVTQPVSGTFWQATQPVSGTFWQATQPVSIATMPSTPVTGTFWQATQPVSGPLTDTQLRASAVPVSGTFFQATQPISGTVTANIGTSGSLALDASVTGLQVAQGSTTSAQKGELVQAAVTTAAPSYTTAQTSPLSLTTAGALRTDASATTQPVSGTVTTNQGGTWTVQPGNTANTTAWKVDGSAVTQPVSGTFWQATQPVSGTVTANQGTANATPWNENTAQIAGAAVSTAASGVQKVGVVGNAGAALDAANNASMPANAIATGLQTATIDTTPTAATAGNLRYQLASTEGVAYVQEGGPKRFSCVVPSTTTALTQCQAAPAAGLRAYVTSLTMSNAAATVQTLDVVFGTGTNCATGATALTHKVQFGTNATTTSPQSYGMQFQTPLVPTAANAICVRPSAATAFGATLTGYIAP
jgi:hypothetical protein